MGNYDSKKRTKPCAACKRQKLKCIYGSSLPCERCLKQGMSCCYPEASKAGSYTKKRENAVRQRLSQGLPSSQPLNSRTSLSVDKSLSSLQNISESDSLIAKYSKVLKGADGFESANGAPWDHVGQTVDQRINVLQDALNSIVTTLQKNRFETSQELKYLRSQVQGLQYGSRDKSTSGVSLPSLSEIISEEESVSPITDFRAHNVITLADATELLELFINKMSAHMFGYSFENITALELWNHSPILLVSVCAVACRHHPLLKAKQIQLIASLRWFTSQLINSNESNMSSKEAKRTILALVIASLWFETNRLYLSIALQLARNWKIDEEGFYEDSDEGWKLWYLLYIADGAQNLLSQKSPSIYKQSEPMILSSRKHLIENTQNSKLKKVLQDNSSFGKAEIASNKQLFLLNKVEQEKIRINSSQLQNIRLCGLVEYHMAIESIFHRKSQPHGSIEAASILLKPSSLGIPWKSNMDLDKWMVSWTITLQNIDVQNDAWCLKSTLLYYNFARMHINTDWLLNRSVNPIDSSNKKSDWANVWKSIEPATYPDLKNASNEISISAATSLLKLATQDKDISSLFQFLPNHVYLMLFYACMIMLRPPASFDTSDTLYIKKLQKNFNLVKSFRDLFVSDNSSDSEFTRKIMEGADELMRSFMEHCVEVSQSSKVQSSKVVEIIQNRDQDSSSEVKRKTISAWPSINPGHP